VSPIAEDAKIEMIKKTKCFIFDCDGVIWRGDSVIEGVPETLEMLRAMGKKLFFVTNNSTKSRKGYLKKFTSLGLNVNAEEIYSSSYAAAAYLESISFPKDKKVRGQRPGDPPSSRLPGRARAPAGPGRPRRSPARPRRCTWWGMWGSWRSWT